MTKYAHIIGTDSSAPDNILTNFDLEEMVDTSNDLIVARTGIRNRHIANKETESSDLANSGKEIDLLLPWAYAANLLTVSAGGGRLQLDPGFISGSVMLEFK